MSAHAEATRLAGRTIVFVPTMGYLHEGHISLVREGKNHGDHLVVSIFVNPTQFGPTEDLDSYPRNMEGDLALLEKEGVAAVYTPRADTMYGEGYETYVSLERLPNHLCGLSRPQFFRGVATVVTKLFNTVRPHAAVFGEKDFQQLAVIRRMTRDLDFPIKIIGGPTVREADGLAMSSRNAYLSPGEREQATVLYKALTGSRDAAAAGETSARTLLDRATALISAVPGTRIDYIRIVNRETMEDVAELTSPVQMVMAVWLGKTRLIDNMELVPPTGR